MPEAVLSLLQQIEQELGRRREHRWGQRTIDLDLLLYDDVVLHAPSLQLPHPRMAWRRFVLEPAAEVAGAMIHPETGWTIARLLEHINTTPPYVAVAGPIAVGKTQLAHRLAESLAARRIDEEPNWDHLADFYADPPSHAMRIELEFLEDRAKRLALVSRPCSQASVASNAGGWFVSDFWFDQSLAFSRAWLPQERLPELVERWAAIRQGVPHPRLVILLDAPAEVLVSRLQARGRPCERNLTEDQLERIRRALLETIGRPDVGPILRLPSDDPEIALTEAAAAARATE